MSLLLKKPADIQLAALRMVRIPRRPRPIYISQRAPLTQRHVEERPPGIPDLGRTPAPVAIRALIPLAAELANVPALQVGLFRMQQDLAPPARPRKKPARIYSPPIRLCCMHILVPVAWSGRRRELLHHTRLPRARCSADLRSNAYGDTIHTRPRSYSIIISLDDHARGDTQ